MTEVMEKRRVAVKCLRELEGLERAAQSLRVQVRPWNLPEDPVARKALRKAYRDAARQVNVTRRALEILTPEERLIAYRLFILPARGNVGLLCQELGVEQSSVYRKRDKMLQKVGEAMFAKLTVCS